MRRRSDFALLLCLALAGCAVAPAQVPQQVPLVWPEEPDAPRIAFMRTIARPGDLGIAKGFLERVGEWIFGASEERILRPMAVLAAKGVVYVADPGVKGVHRFDSAAGRYDVVRREGGLPLQSPVGLAAGSDGEVYVTDSALAAVFVIRPGTDVAVKLALPALQQPTGIVFDRESGRLLVVDTKAHRVNAFNRDGTLHTSFGQRGAGEGEFNYPTQIWRDSRGHLFVTDSLNFRIQVLDAQGRFLRKFGQVGDGPGDFMRHKGLATDSFGHVYIVDALLHAMQIFDASGRLLLSVGDLGHGRGEFWLPAGLYIGDDDTIYVADSYNQRIQVFRYIGGPT